MKQEVQLYSHILIDDGRKKTRISSLSNLLILLSLFLHTSLSPFRHAPSLLHWELTPLFFHLVFQAEIQTQIHRMYLHLVIKIA